MKKQLLKQVCGLCIGVAGALAPIASVQAVDELYMGFTPGSASTQGAKGPVREESAAPASKPMKQESFRNDQPLELYTGFSDDKATPRGAQGPIRETPATPETKPLDQKQIDREWSDRYSGGS